MIKKFIDKLLGKSGARRQRQGRFGKRQEVAGRVHGIDPALVDERAKNVVTTLQQAGYEAYVVGGAVRDLLLGLRPKDFDVATNATPEQVKSLFRRAFIIGRRFRIVHVVYGRGREHEVIEVSTFRAYMDNAARRAGRRATSAPARANSPSMKHAVDSPAAACCATTSGARRTKTPRAATSPSTPCTTTRPTRSWSTITTASRTRRSSRCA